MDERLSIRRKAGKSRARTDAQTEAQHADSDEIVAVLLQRSIADELNRQIERLDGNLTEAIACRSLKARSGRYAGIYGSRVRYRLL
jgi:hypothetical protein